MSLTKIPEQTRQLVIDRNRDRSGRIRCAHCNDVVAKGGFDIDHIIPEADSTPDKRIDPDNLQVLCSRPKSDPKGWGCHQKKSAAEAREWARRNRPARNWVALLMPGWIGLGLIGYLFVGVTAFGICIGGIVFLMCTILVKNGFRSRRPQEGIPADWVSRETAGIDTVRAAATVREVVGQKGDVRVTSENERNAVVAYPGTGFNDSRQGDDRLKFIEYWNAKMGGRWEAEWDTAHDKVHLAMRPDLPARVDHPSFFPHRAWHHLPVAEGCQFDLMMTSHILIIGKTNAGKTSLMRGLIAALCKSAAAGQVELLLADPKQIELLGFLGWPGVRGVLTTDEELWDMAMDLEAEMRERFRAAKAKERTLSSYSRIILVLDEYEQYFKRMRRLWQNSKDPKYKKVSGQVVPPPIDAIQSILSMARRCGIHLILGTQSPDATWFGGTGVRENLQGRASVGPIGPQQARMAYDDSSVGTDLPPGAKGRTTVQMLDGQPMEVQAYWTPDPSDIDGENTAEDWQLLQMLGMPKHLVPL